MNNNLYEDEENQITINNYPDPCDNSIDKDSLVQKAGSFLSKKINDEINNSTSSSKVIDLATRALQTNADKEENAIDKQDVLNSIDRYRIKCEENKLKLRTKLEKKVIKQEVKADIFLKKYNNTIKRYGYLYNLETVETIDANGNAIIITRPKDFTISTFANKMKAFSKWYKNLGDTTKIIIKNTWKLVFWCGISIGIILLLYHGIKFLSLSGILNI